MNVHLLTAIIEFGRGQQDSVLSVEKMRNYFLIKAELASNVKDA